MKLGERIVDGVFLDRPNRYFALVRVDGREVGAHVPDPGRLPGLMIPGRRVRLIHNPGPKRKTDYTLVLVRHGRIWVSVFPVFANKLVEQALDKRELESFSGYEAFAREVREGNSRFDFRLDYPDSTRFVEVKSVSLVVDGEGRFPDAPTERGTRHLRELIELKKKGRFAAVVFVSQRSDTRRITANISIDPGFSEALVEADRAGVELYGYNCKVSSSTVSLNRVVQVVLP